MSKQLPPKISLEQLRKQAKFLLERLNQGQLDAVETVGLYFPPLHAVGLTEVQFVLAQEYGFESWIKLKDHVRHSLRVDDAS